LTTGGYRAALLSAVLALPGATTGAQVLQTLLQELLELGTGATLEQHVPVAAGGLHVGVVDLDGNVVDQATGLGTAVLALPRVGSFGLSRKDGLGLFAAYRAKIGVTGTRRVDDAFFAL
jgi:hypothetical protein